jgi:hypothetical protein
LVLVTGLATCGEELYQHFVNKEDLDIFELVASAVSPIPAAMTFLLSKGETAIDALIVVDGVFDISSTVLSMISMYTKWEGLAAST